MKVDRAGGGGGGGEEGSWGFEVGGGRDDVVLKVRDLMRSVEWSDEEEGKMLLYIDIMAKECSRNISM